MTASHCTGYVGINLGTNWGQPWLSSAIGIEFEDPPLTDCDPSSLMCLTDVALIDLNNAHDNSTNTLPGHVYLTDFSSSAGSGGFAISQDAGPLWSQSPLVGMAVNKVGMATGWTTGEITGTCVTIDVPGFRHPDGTVQPSRLPCTIRANTPLFGGDSGSPLFSLIYDPEPDGGGFLGILSSCAGCQFGVSNDAFYVSWAALTQALNANITLF